MVDPDSSVGSWAVTIPLATVGRPEDQAERLLHACEQEWSITITVHDRSGQLTHPDGQWMLPWFRYLHRHSFCIAERTHDVASERCLAHCQVAVNQLAATRLDGFVHSCWKGASEVVQPIVRDGRHALTLFAGPRQGDPAVADPSCSAEVQRLAASLPPLRDAAGIRAGLQMLGAALLAWADSHRLQVTDDDHRRRTIRDWVGVHLGEAIGLDDLACHLALSGSRTSHVVQGLFAMSFTELVITQRLNRAQQLLATTQLPAARIAERCGFASAVHFTRLFHQRLGLPPGQWRAQREPHLGALMR